MPLEVLKIEKLLHSSENFKTQESLGTKVFQNSRKFRN
jgi:hypothetical protein